MKRPLKNWERMVQRRLIPRKRYKYVGGQRYSGTETGYVMFVTIAMVLILVSLLATFFALSKVESASTAASASSSTGFYAAEAGLNLRANQVQSTFVGYNRPSGTSPGDPSKPSNTAWQECLSSTSSYKGTGDFTCDSSKTFQNQKVLTYVVEDAGNPNLIQIGPTEPFAGLNAQEYRYDLTSVAVNSQNLPSAMLGMRFKSRLVPLFQFLAFYNNDLDFFIPPNMNLSGPVHTNGDLYLDASSTGTLTINGQVTTAGTLYRGEKYTNTNSCNGTVNIYNPTTAQSLGCGSGGTRKSYNQSGVSSWNNQIQVGIKSLQVPPPSALDPTPGQIYWSKADLRLALKLDTSGNPSAIEVRNPDQTLNSTATASLNSCPATPVMTLQNNPVGGTTYSASNTKLQVNSVNGFNVGDAVIVGADFDSNVIAINGVDLVNKRLTLTRQLGHANQTFPIPSVGNTVRKAVVSTSDTFYNYREKNGSSGIDAGNYIRMLNVDLRALLDCAYQTYAANPSQSLMGKNLDDNSDGGLVLFLTVDGPNSNTDVTQGGNPNNYGVRIYNAAQLASTMAGAPAIQGLTVVSDQPIYVLGDYNSTNKKPAAILTDALNILSNAWTLDDTHGRGYVNSLPATTVWLTNSVVACGATTCNDPNAGTNLTPRTATQTTVNAAFLSGTTITGGDNGAAKQNLGSNTLSGGLNNYPRFHENWGGINFNYLGSFISLNPPRRTNSPYCGSLSSDTSCNIYNPPFRNWNYDTNFNNAANLPPLTPRAVYLKQEVFSRNFDR